MTQRYPRPAMSQTPLLGLLMSALLATPLSAQEVPESRLSVPVEIPLADIAGYANRLLPGELHRNSYGRTCVEPERVCTKVPEFRGFKVTMKNRCAEVSPRIDCTIDELVRREGGLSVTGTDNGIAVSQDIFGSGTVTGRGEIGRNIRQTVRARARMTVTARPGLRADWTPVMPVDIAYRWLERPEFRLFNLFPITLGSTLGPPLDNAIEEFQSRQLPAELAKIDIRSEAERLWQALQHPVALELPGQGDLFLHFRPRAVGLHGPSFDGGRLRARLDLAFRASVSDREAGPPRSNLPNLTPLSDGRIAVHVPVEITTETLTSLVAASLPATFDVGDAATASVTVHEADLSVAAGRLIVDAVVDASGGPLSLTSEPVRISATPLLTGDSLAFEGIELQSARGGLRGAAANLLLNGLALFLSDTVSVAIGEDIAALQAALNDGLNREIATGLRLEGGGELTVSDLTLSHDPSAFRVVVGSVGQMRVRGFDPLRR